MGAAHPATGGVEGRRSCRGGLELSGAESTCSGQQSPNMASSKPRAGELTPQHLGGKKNHIKSTHPPAFALCGSLPHFVRKCLSSRNVKFPHAHSYTSQMLICISPKAFHLLAQTRYRKQGNKWLSPSTNTCCQIPCLLHGALGCSRTPLEFTLSKLWHWEPCPEAPALLHEAPTAVGHSSIYQLAEHLILPS